MVSLFEKQKGKNVSNKSIYANNCSICKFAVPAPVSEFIYCHRYPPKNKELSGPKAQYPLFLAEAEWCGELVVQKEVMLQRMDEDR